jgi:hypothetical protein
MRRLLRNPLAAVAMHWTFQSLFYMDRTERRFKLLLDALLAAIGIALLSTRCSWPLALALAFLGAHTLNFLFNGHLWGVLKHYGLISLSYEAFSSYAQGFGARAEREPSIRRVAIYGSLARHRWSPSSDLDVRLVRQPGLINGARACWFVLRERSRALIARFPLDAYVLDDDRSLQKLSAEEEPIDMARHMATAREIAAAPKRNRST